jgi:subtilisin family serine protease
MKFLILGLGVFILALVAGLQADGLSAEARSNGQGVAGRYIVVLADGVSPGDVAARHNAVPDFVYQHAVNGFAGPLGLAQVNALRLDPRVLVVEQDQIVTIAGGPEPPTGIRRIFAPGNTKIGINGVDDWRIDVDVAVIDTGISLSHPDLNVVASVNCSGGGPFKQSCGSGGDDDNNHGTHVAGTIAALDNGIGVVGVAPGARLWAVKVLDKTGSGYMSWIIAGVDYVTANAAQIEVANMSLGCECTSTALNTAISNSVKAGVVYVVAAGNSAKDASTFSPANHPDVITVSALADFNGLAGGGAAPTCRPDEDDTLANFSNFGARIDIAAPGVCITSTVPGGYATYSGTSMASPHVAGAAALLTSRTKPTNKSGVETVRSTLKSNGNLNWTDDSGDGIKERLLDVSSTAVFDPVKVAGSSGSTSTETGTISGTVTSSGVGGIAGATVSVGGTSLYATTAGDGSYTISNVPVGTYSLTASATGYHSATTDSVGVTSGTTTPVNFALVAVTGEVGTVTADTYTCTFSGGKNKNKDLSVAISVVDGTGSRVSGALISFILKNTTSTSEWAMSGTTGSDGIFTAKLINAPSGDYAVNVTDLSAPGLTWVQPTPPEGSNCSK